MRTWIPIALFALATGVLGLQVFRLSGEVRQLSRAVGGANNPGKGDAASPRSEDPLSRRVATLEQELEATNGRVALLHARHQLAAGTATNAPADPDRTKEEVLSIVADETDRILVKQLLWHRSNLMSARKPGFRAFEQGAQLTPAQSQSVWGHLEAEADEFVDLLRIPELREDPEALVREIRAVLASTDDKVRRVLNADQIRQYEHGRALERAALMPWAQTLEPGR
jgi:hypothetical protein